MTFFPLIFSPAFHARVWGGRNLEKFLEKKLPAQRIIGESWEIYDTNIIINGEYSGHTLKELLSQFPREIGGTLYDGGDFPLLVKFLDAQDWLYVQVHPNDELAQSLEGQPRGKTECWYVVEAEPDAAIIYGFSEKKWQFRGNIFPHSLGFAMRFNVEQDNDVVIFTLKGVYLANQCYQTFTNSICFRLLR